MRTLLTLLLALFVLSSSADNRPRTSAGNRPRATAQRPDMDIIKDATTDPANKRYYPKLMERYEKNETIMTVEDYRYLYLGAVFQEDYNPYRHSPLDVKIDELYYKKNHSRAELDTIIAYAEQALLDDPFDLQQINFLIYALRERGKVNRAKIWQYRLNHLLEAILSTGTGTDPANAWVVIDPKHEYNILNFKNIIAKDARYIEPHYDFIEIEATDSPEGENAQSGYYFDISYILSEYYRKHPEMLRNDY